ncbi:MAG: hypothetical protein COY75_08035 [Nitrospirae bacterium CG_4_10_14_0_8_um_filter_41_23]|nr:MAG: hypothetical protein AUK38_04920 [Nitrospirae bacterium CG2_30_41_42]PIQ94246.1 MAG: hypothetical protein COV68_05625 [Nitrospirae bacterium CG11_big_fil_rev_8_21_14_0_20_41_14]PIV43863.1 MAG: hypothetical protein COS27_03810 [Nitrospirae bacterium CG02_land_8_20_14_3_00_41_53]PIW88293.1 MAG: hypothetical protein COZ94_00510 [Nitrospirae bacterium CG_4_8_14_3_um_filter_41_47]PIY86448.1 MAG: hypothetical protein COY75_08035 [Nitrospirae bacterium CG_4_10_14_0_8_um_filter_41_23]PJA79788.
MVVQIAKRVIHNISLIKEILRQAGISSEEWVRLKNKIVPFLPYVRLAFALNPEEFNTFQIC